MALFDVLSMIGGLALFLYGMHLLGEGLEKCPADVWNVFPTMR